MIKLNGNNLLCFLKKWWFLAAFVFATGGFVTSTQMTNAAQAEDIGELKRIQTQQANIQTRQQEMLEKMGGQIELILMLLGMKNTDSIAQRWQMMPLSPPLDSVGTPIEGGEWLCITDEYLFGKTLKWTNGGRVLVRVEWDVRPRRDTL
jgi:hypothetical protein